MNIFLGFKTATTDFVAALGFIAKYKLWHYFLFPVLIYVLLFVSLLSVKGVITDSLIDGLLPLIGLEEVEKGSWLDYLKMGVTGFVYILVWTSVTLVFTTTSKYITLIVLSPVLAFLSERVEEIETGNTYPFNFAIFIKDVIRGVLISIRNLFLEYAVIAILFILGLLLPVLSPILLPIELAFGWYFLGFTFMDYSLERRRYNVKQSAQFIRRNKGAAIGNGMWFSLLFSIPVVGGIFAPIIAVVGASKTSDKLLQNKDV